MTVTGLCWEYARDKSLLEYLREICRSLFEISEIDKFQWVISERGRSPIGLS